MDFIETLETQRMNKKRARFNLFLFAFAGLIFALLFWLLCAAIATRFEHQLAGTFLSAVMPAIVTFMMALQGFWRDHPDGRFLYGCCQTLFAITLNVTLGILAFFGKTPAWLLLVTIIFQIVGRMAKLGSEADRESKEPEQSQQ